MKTLETLLGIALPIIQAPMAGVQDHKLTLAVSNAGGLGSLPCAMLSLETLRKELTEIRAHTTKPYNVNFFCHQPTTPIAAREATWRATLAPYYRELGLDQDAISAGPGRSPFSAEIADVLTEFKPAVVSFHFGLPSPICWHACVYGVLKYFVRRPQWKKRFGLRRMASMPSLRRGLKQVVIAAISCRTISVRTVGRSHYCRKLCAL